MAARVLSSSGRSVWKSTLERPRVGRNSNQCARLLEWCGAPASVAGHPADLTPTEYRLLVALLERRGRVQSRDQLLHSAWDVHARIETRTVDMHVQRLRGKLGDDADWIETVRGFGYRFRTDPPANA